MRLTLVAMGWMMGLAGMASAQPVAGNLCSCAIANHANGFDYQPTQRQVAPREVAAGVAPSRAQQDEEDRTLASLDRSLMLSEGLGTASLPVFTSRR